MRPTKKFLCPSALSFLFLVCASTLACAVFQDSWQFEPGALIVSGGRTTSFKNANGYLLSVNAHRRVSYSHLAEASAYHAIIFHPDAPFMGGGSGFSNKGPLSTETITWKLQKNPPDDYQNWEEKSLEIKFHGLNKTITVEAKTFPLSKGNLFIIRLDGSWVPSVTQLPATFDKHVEDNQNVLKFFKSVLKDDELIQELELN